MRAFAICTILAGCALPRPALDTKVDTACCADTLHLDIPNLGHWQVVDAKLTNRSAGAATPELPGTWRRGSSRVSFHPVRPGAYEVSVTYVGDDNRQRTWQHTVQHEPPFASRLIDPQRFGFTPDATGTRAPLLLAVPQWSDLSGDRAHARAEFVAAARRVLDEVIGPTTLVVDEQDLIRIEDESSTLSSQAGSRLHRPRLLCVLDLRLPGELDLPCQLVLSMFQVGKPDTALWNLRRMLHQEFVPLPDYRLSSDRCQSDMLIHAVGEALRTARCSPAARHALGLESGTEDAEPSDVPRSLFPALFAPTPPSPHALPAPTPSDSTSSNVVVDSEGRGKP